MDHGKRMRRIVGLQYEPSKRVPQVIVKGSGPAAEEILRRGQMAGHPRIIEDVELVDQLFKLPVDAHIGPELFDLVAVLLAHVFRLEQEASGASQ